jgi:hypothetical protein
MLVSMMEERAVKSISYGLTKGPGKAKGKFWLKSIMNHTVNGK